MKKSKIFIFFIIITIFVVSYFTPYAYSQAMESPLLYNGGADSRIYKSDTVVLENTALDDAWKIQPANTVSVGFSLLYSPYLVMAYFPFSYSPIDWFEMSISVPFQDKFMSSASNERSKNGFGDIKLGLTFSFAPLNKFITNTRIKITFPTGDPCARDRDLIVPMGYGAITLSLLQSFSTMHFGAEKFKVRFFINMAAYFYSDAQLDPDDTVRYHVDYSYAISSLAGVEFMIVNKFFIQCKTAYMYLPERRHKYEIFALNTVSRWTDVNDSIHAIDIIPAIKYNFLEDFSGTVMTIIPIYEQQDDGIDHPRERKWKIYLGLEKSFGFKGSTKKAGKAIKRKRE